jgi:origin recognition complex subunit 1
VHACHSHVQRDLTDIPKGVGKTACIRAAICELRHEQAAGQFPDFEFVALNCMEMRHPFEAYVRLWRRLSAAEKALSAESAASCLELMFSGKRKSSELKRNRPIVVLLDEIDYLVTRKQTVLYNFFDWPVRSCETGSTRKLIVIGVSNTLNLPERLHPRVQSRIGSNRIFFKSYNVNESLAILKSKLVQASPNYSVFDEDATLFAAKKTAALSGDIRKAFNICREAAELVLNDTQKHRSYENLRPVVHIKDVLRVSRESSNTAHARAAKCSSPHEVLVMIAIASLSKTTGRELGGFDTLEITVKVKSIASTTGSTMYYPPPDTMEILTILSELEAADLVTLCTTRNSSMSYRSSLAGCGGTWPLASLSIDDQTLYNALKKTQHDDLASKYLLYNY